MIPPKRVPSTKTRPTRTAVEAKTKTTITTTRTTSRKREKSPEPAPTITRRVKKENKPVKQANTARTRPSKTNATTRLKTATAAVKSKATPLGKVKTATAKTKESKAHTDTELERPRKRAKQERAIIRPLPLVPYVPTNPLNPLPAPTTHYRPASQLFYWGAGNFGQFGMGAGVLGEYGKPKKHTWVENGLEEGRFGEKGAGIEAAAGGGLHTILIDETGRVWTCGVNDDAALGRSVKDVPDPENPGKFLDVDVLTSLPHVVQTLQNEGFRAVRIAAGDNLGAALSDNGSLRVWGTFKSKEGSLGFSSENKHQWEPVPILPNKGAFGKPEACVDITCGSNHILALTTSGDVYAWGDGEQGQLGRKILERTKIHGVIPERVVIGTRTNRFKAIGAGTYTSFAVDADGDVWGWGLNNMGQTGTNADYGNEELVVQSPKLISALSPDKLEGDQIIQISGGEHHTIFLTQRGRVFSCGRGEGGQLGLADNHPAVVERVGMLEGKDLDYIITPSEVKFPTDTSIDPIVRIGTGIRNNIAVTRDGALYSWGEGNQGELGLGEDELNAPTPTIVVRREGGSWRAVDAACGGQHTIGVFRKRE